MSGSYSNSRSSNSSSRPSRDNDGRRPHRYEEEQLGYEEMVQQTKSTRNKTLDVTRDALSRLRSTEEGAMKTMEKLNEQSNVLRKAKASMEVTKANQQLANEKVTELKQLSKWLPFGNPFRSNSGSKKVQEAKLKADYENSMRESDDARKMQRESKQTLDGVRKHAERSERQRSSSKSSRYRSELLDEEDHEAENEIESNLDEISSMTSRLKMMATGMSTELANQNKIVEKLSKEADDTNVSLKVTQGRMKRWQ